MLIVLFGLPGAGKTFVGNLLQQKFSFFHFDGDAVLPENMRQKILDAEPITDEIRDAFFKRIVEEIKTLQPTHKNIVVSQTFLKQKYRDFISQAFPDTQFILVETTKEIRDKRLAKRNTMTLSRNYIQQMINNFDKPSGEYSLINNDHDGSEDLEKQLDNFFLQKKVQ